MDFMSGIGQAASRAFQVYRQIKAEQKAEEQGERQQALGLFQSLLTAPKWQRAGLRKAYEGLFPNVRIQGDIPEPPEEPEVDIPGIGPVPRGEAHKYIPLLPGHPAQRQAGAAETRAEADQIRAQTAQSALQIQKDRLQVDKDRYLRDEAYRRDVLTFNKAKQKALEAFQKAQNAIAQGRLDVAKAAQAEMARHQKVMEGIAQQRVNVSRAAVGRAMDPRKEAWDAFFSGKASPQQMQYVQSQMPDRQASTDLGIVSRLGGLEQRSPAEEKIYQTTLTRLAKRLGINVDPKAVSKPGGFWSWIREVLGGGGWYPADTEEADQGETEEDDLDDLYGE